MKTRTLFLILLLLGAVSLSFAVTRTSVASGNLNEAASWSPSAIPIAGDALIIANGHTITVSANTVSLLSLTINAGGILSVSPNFTVSATTITVNGTYKNKSTGAITKTTMNVNNGATYEHAVGSGTIPTANWGATSTCKVSVATGNITTAIQNFGNLIWDCPTQTSDVRFTNRFNTQGSFSILNTNTGSFRFTNDLTYNINGDFVCQGKANFGNTTTHTLNVDGNFTLSGGSFNNTGASTGVLNIAGNFTHSGGTLAGTINIGGLLNVNFTKAGTQTFTSGGGTLSGVVHYTVNSGSTLDMGAYVLFCINGTFTLSSGAGIITAHSEGIASTGFSGCIVGGTRTYSAGANYTYNGSAAQVTGNGLTTANNLTINNAAGVTLTNAVTVNGVLTQIAGTLTGTRNVDGYSSTYGANGFNYINIAESGGNMDGFILSTNTSGPFPDKIKRQWTIYATNTRNKTVTFYWDAADDENYNWGSAAPAVYKGSSKHSVLSSSLSTNPRWVIVENLTIDNLSTKDNYTIGRFDDGTVPVELSSFTAVVTSENFVALHWTTQTETNVAGYYIYRNTLNDLNTAFRIPTLIAATNTSQEASYTFVDQEVVPGTYYYWLQNLDINGDFDFHGPVNVTLIQGNGGDTPPVIPTETALLSAYPNPFNPITNLRYSLKNPGFVTIDVYNNRGQLIRHFSNDHPVAGYYKVTWDGKDMNGKEVSSGIYCYRMKNGKFTSSKKMVLLK